MTTKGETSNLT